jgi:uncharacterized protein YraI
MLYFGKFTRRLPHMRIFLIACLLGWAVPAIAQSHTATVAEGVHVNLRTGKTDNYRVIRVLAPGTKVEVIETEQSYAKVKTAEGDIGWMPARLLILEPMDTQPAAATTGTPVQEASPPATVPTETTASEQTASGPPFPWRLLLVGGLCFLLGTAVGVGLHEMYYRKRLNGLRI